MDKNIIECKPISNKPIEKSTSITIIKRYPNKTDPEKTTKYNKKFYQELLAHRIDNSPRLRAFSI
jgi:hypothetical protein